MVPGLRELLVPVIPHLPGYETNLNEDACHRSDRIRGRPPGRAARARGPRGPLPGARPRPRLHLAAARLRACARATCCSPGACRAPATGIDVAYYLVHSMGRGKAGDYRAKDARRRAHFAAMARREGVERVIYLGGLGDNPRLRAPAQPPRDRRGAGRRGTAADLFPRRDGGGRAQRVLPHPALPGGAPAGDDRTRLAQDQDAADRDRRRRSPTWSRRRSVPAVHRPRGADRRTGRPLLRRHAGPHGRRRSAATTGPRCPCRSSPPGSHRCGSGS